MFFLTLFLMNCANSNTSISETHLSEYLDFFDTNPENTVTFIYLDGCSGCHDLYKSILETIPVNKENLIFILTNSPKKAKLIFGDKLIAGVFFDKDYKAFKYSLIENFPVVYKFQKGRLIESKVVKKIEDLDDHIYE